MEKLYQSEIYAKVKAFIDEVGENDAEFMLSDSDTRNIETIINEVTPLSVRNVFISAPNGMLTGEPYTKDFSIDSTTFIGEITLPEDFLRLVSAKLSSWGSPVTRVITEDMAEYRMQSNKYMRGTYNKPVCAVVSDVVTPESGGSKQVHKLELYSAKATTDTLRLVLLKEPTWELDDNKNEQYVSICPRLKHSIIAQITGQLLLALSEDQRAQTFLTLSSNYSQ